MIRRHREAAAIFLLLLALLTNPLLLHLWNAVQDKQDALLNTWIIAWVGHAAVTDPLNLYNSNIFYPYPNTLAFSEVLVPQGLLALPITLATDNPILGYNLALVAMLYLDAFAMYLLALEWTHSRAAGWIAGVIYAFNPFNLGNLAQIQLLSLGWLPLTILFLRRVLDRRGDLSARRRVTRDAFLFCLFFFLQSLSSIYFAVLAGLAVLIYFGWWGLTRLADTARFEHGISVVVSKAITELIPGITALAVSLLLVAAALVPFLLPYFSVERELGFQRSVQDSEPFSANLKEFTEVSPQNVIYGRMLAPNPVKYNGGYPLDNLFPGLAPLLLAAIGLSAGKSRERWFLLMLVVLAFVLSLGPRLYITAEEASDLTLPYRWLYDIFPLLRALRAPVRFDALVMFGLAVLGGYGIAAITANRRQRGITLFVAGLIALEYLAVPAASTTVLPVASEIPPVYDWLANQAPSVSLELPMMGPDAQNQLDISKQYFTTFHWQKTPDGYSGFNPPGRGEIAYEMQFFPNARTISLMQALGVRYLLVHGGELGLENPPVQDQIRQIPVLKHIDDFSDVSVYRVAPYQFAVSDLEKELYLPQPAQAGGLYTAYLILADSSSIPFAVKPTDRIDLTAHWSDGRTEHLSLLMRLVTSTASIVPIPLQAPALHGRFSLRIEADQSLIGPVMLNGEVQVGDESARETVAPASVELAQPPLGEYSRGGTVTVKLDWLPLNKIDAYYSVSVRVVDRKGEKIVQVDRQPRVPTLLWTPGVGVPDTFQLPLPRDLTPGQYQVELLMYDVNGGMSVLLLDKSLAPQQTITLGEFKVE
jgi:hypothetical protein